MIANRLRESPGQLLNFGPIDRWTKADIGTMLLNEKFSCVAGGTYHFLLLSENSRLYGAGDNTYVRVYIVVLGFPLITTTTTTGSAMQSR